MDSNKGNELYRVVPPWHQISKGFSLLLVLAGIVLFVFSPYLGITVFIGGVVFSGSILSSRNHVLIVYENGIKTGFYRTYGDPFKQPFPRMWGEGFRFLEFSKFQKIIPVTFHTFTEDLSGIRVIATGEKSFGDRKNHYIVKDIIRFGTDADIHNIMNIMRNCFNERWDVVFEKGYTIDSKNPP